MMPRSRATRAAVAGTAVAVLLGSAAVAASPLMASGDTGAARAPGSADAGQDTVTRDGRAMTWRLS